MSVDSSNSARRLPVVLIATLALLSAVSPLATDMYLPALPEMTEDLVTTASAAQLTLTAFMIGLGAGQLVIGSLSDALGRRGPLLVGTIVCLAASIICALAPSIEVLVGARLLQGFSGAAGVVIARAMITDITDGPQTVKLMNVMMVIGSLMPVIAPFFGGITLQFGTWRGIFWVIAALVAFLIVAVVLVTEESLPPPSRRSGGIRVMAGTVGMVLRNRAYVSAMLVPVFAFGTLFAYVSASPFVIQNVLGLPTMAYSLVFGANALAMTAGSAISIRLAGRVEVQRTLGAGLLGATAASVGLVAMVFLGAPAAPIFAGFFLTTLSMGFIFGNGAAIAMRSAAGAAGTASAFMGSLQFTMGALVSPLVGLAGEADARPMALVMAVCSLLAGFSYLTHRRTRPPGPTAY